MTTTNNTNKGWNIGLWIAQILLAFAFGMAGFMKATQPIDALVSSGMNWAGDMPALARFIGTCQLLGVVGLILPSLLRIQPKLTVWAGIALATNMLFAVVFHIAMGEGFAAPPFFLGVFAAFVAWGRSKKAVIQPKS